jgi:hypothetical protein
MFASTFERVVDRFNYLIGRAIMYSLFVMVWYRGGKPICASTVAS